MEKAKYQGLYNDEVFCHVLKKDETAMRVCQTIFPDAKISEVLLNTAKCEQNDVNGAFVQIAALDENKKEHYYSLKMAKKKDDLGRLARYCTSKMDMKMFKLVGERYFGEDSATVLLCDFDPFGMGLTKYVSRSGADDKMYLADQCPLIIINGKGVKGDLSSDMRSLSHVICGDYNLDEPFAVLLKNEIIKANEKLNLVQ